MNFIYINAEYSVVENKLDVIKEIFDGYEILRLDETQTLVIDQRNKDVCFSETDDFVSYTLGYMRDYRLGVSTTANQHNLSVSSEILNENWPLDKNYTGSFSNFCWDKKNKSITIANDIIGIYPLYYHQSDKINIISSHLILTAAFSMQDIDSIGISERLIYADFCNFGRRTTVQNVKRILPGELILLNQNNMEIENILYDNSFYEEMLKPDKNKAAKDTWLLIQKEFDYCLLQDSEIGIAMSGGLDSRLILGAINESKNLYGMAYGDEDFYETKIAKRCLDTRGSDFQSHSVYKYQFPEKELLEKYILKTEATGLMSWLAIFENSNGLKEDSIYLIGDICDGLTGKNILTHKGRKTKVKNFFKYMIFNRDLPFTPLTSDLFEAWKEKTTDMFIGRYNEMQNLNLDLTSDQIIDGIKKDLNELFERISQHQVPFYEQLDEIFGWYTHGRIAMSKQLLQSKVKYFPLAPILSMQIYRNSSNIHPAIRMDFGLLEKVFKAKEFDQLNAIPTAQIPFIANKANNLFKSLVWGFRSTVDQLLIKLQMYSNNYFKRQRVLNSLNWRKAYTDEDAYAHCKEWFETDYISRKSFCLSRLKNRADGSDWPILPFDITSTGAVNLEVGLIKRFKK